MSFRSEVVSVNLGYFSEEVGGLGILLQLVGIPIFLQRLLLLLQVEVALLKEEKEESLRPTARLEGVLQMMAMLHPQRQR